MPNFKRLLGDGSRLGIQLSYVEQLQPNGLAEAFLLGEEFIDGHACAMVLGDNIFYGAGLEQLLINAAQTDCGATVFGYYVSDPERFGVIEFNESGEAISIEEKPAQPKSNYAVTGLYFYDQRVVEYAKTLSPSKRGELEITDLNRIYLENNELSVIPLGAGYAWMDAGTIDSLYEATNYVRTVENCTGIHIAAVEEISFRKGWITLDTLKHSAILYGKSPYGQYLQRIADGVVK